MQIAKFGGTSLANTDTWRLVCNIVKGKLAERQSRSSSQPVLVVVISAIGGVTAALDALARFSCDFARREAPKPEVCWEEKLRPLRDRHNDMAKELLNTESFAIYQKILGQIFGDIQTILEAMALQRQISEDLLELLLPQGELLSSRLFALFLSDSGVDNTWLDSREFIVSKKHNDRTHVDLPACRKSCALAQMRTVNVFPGFIASTPSGRTTVLERNGSDYSATILAYGMQAESVELWTDVDGILTTDPQIVPEASIIREMSIEEAMEMSYFGAKVIYVRALLPIVQHPCPVRICNTFRPEGQGTLIQPKNKVAIGSKRLLTAISYVDNASLFLLDGRFLSSPKFLARVFGAFERYKVEPIMIIRVTADNKLCLTLYKSQMNTAISAISEEFERELDNGSFAPPEEESNISIIAVIGEGMRGKVGTVSGIFSILAKLGVNILAIGQDITENNISFIVHQSDQNLVIRHLHQNYLNTENNINRKYYGNI